MLFRAPNIYYHLREALQNPTPPPNSQLINPMLSIEQYLVKYLIILICNEVCNHRPSTGQDQPGQHLAINNDDGDAGNAGDGGDDGDDSDDDDDVDDSNDDD